MVLAALLAILVIVILALSAFFSGSETALMSLNRYRLRHLESKHRNARAIRDLIAHPEQVLGTILTGNVFVNTAAGAIMTYMVTTLVTSPERRAEAVSVATIVLTGLILVFGEMLPKSVAARHPETWSLTVIRPVLFLIKVTSPIVLLLTWVSSRFLRVLGEKSHPLRHEISLEEIRAIVYSGGEVKEPDSRRRMLRKVLELGDRKVSEVMVPRTEIVAVEIHASFEEILAIIRRERYSRMPVYRQTLDVVEGLVYSKDVIAHWGVERPFHLESLLRKPYFLPDGVKVEQALEQMRKHRVHMAMVVDEHGGVEGLVTLEDLIEEIVGELSDGEEEKPLIQRLANGQYLLEGSIPVKDLNERLGLAVPQLPEYNTLAGYIISRLGRIPNVGDRVSGGGCDFTVERLEQRRVARVRAAPALHPEVAPGARGSQTKGS